MTTDTNGLQATEHLQPSIVVIALRLISMIFLLNTFLGLIIASFFVLNDVHEWHGVYIGFVLLVQVMTFLLITGVVIKLFSEWAGRAYYVSGHHLIEHLGLINTIETTHELSQVKSVVVMQTWLGRRFNFGTIKLKFAGSGKQTNLVLRDINNPVKYKEYFDRHMQVQGWVR